VVNCKPMKSGEHVLKYLTPYIFRVALCNKRLVKVENDKVTFLYRDRKTNEEKTRTLPALIFIRYFLRHVLPHRFCKVRYYGFLALCLRKRFQAVKDLLNVPSDQQAPPKDPEGVSSDGARERRKMYCPICKGEMQWVCTILPLYIRAP
jgi:hypothetical protein